MTSKGPSTGGGITWRAGWYRSAVALGRPIAVSAGAIWASESFTITVLIGKDSSARKDAGARTNDGRSMVHFRPQSTAAGTR